MALLFELLLTTVVTLLAAFLLATFFAANDPRREPDRAAAAIAGEVVEEERIIEVDEVNLSEGRARVVEAEGWVEVEKAPAVVVEEEPECSPEHDEEGVPMKLARGVGIGAGLKEAQEEQDVVEKRRGLTPAAAATGVVFEADQPALAAEAVPREVQVLDVGLEEGRMQDAGAQKRDLGAEAAPSEVLFARPEKHAVQAVEVAEVLPMELEAVELEQQHLVSEVAPAVEVVDAGLQEEKGVEALEVRRDELPAEAAPEEIVDAVMEEEEQIVEANKHELAAEVTPQPVLDVPLAEKEELKDQQTIEEAVNVNDEVQRKEEAKCDTRPVVQLEKLAPEEELVVMKTGDAEVSHKGSSSDKVVTELPVEVETLPELLEDDAEADMDFGEWEGIERSEVEKRFGAAAAFAASEVGAAALSKLDSDVQLQLQGLLKVAIDGPCYESTLPLTLRPSSRAKWVAWQKLGNMHPEIAMEKYMNLLSETIPGWLENETSDTKKHEAGGYSEGSILMRTAATDQHSNQGNEGSTSIDEGCLSTSPNPKKGESSDIPAE